MTNPPADTIERVARAIDPQAWMQIDRWRAAARCYRYTDPEKAGFQDAEAAEALATDCDRKADKNVGVSFAKAIAAIEAMQSVNQDQVERLTGLLDRLVKAAEPAASLRIADHELRDAIVEASAALQGSQPLKMGDGK